MDLVNNVLAESERLNSYEKFRLLILRIYSTFTQSNIGDGAFCKNSWRLKFEAEFAHASIIFQALKMTNIFAFLPPRCCSLCFRYTRDLKFKKGQIQNLTWSSPITQTPFFKGWGGGGGGGEFYLPPPEGGTNKLHTGGRSILWWWLFYNLYIYFTVKIVLSVWI